jgi:phage terminase large subunit-like protein
VAFANLIADLLVPEGQGYLPQQRPPAAGWTGWMYRGGRGAGKSHALTGYLRDEVARNPTVRGRIIGPTLGDIIEADVYGPAGILAKDDRVDFRPNAPGGAKLVWPTGAEFLLIGIPTRKDVERLRASGNRELDLWEEGAAIPYLEEAWSQAELGRRIGKPRWMMATTPRARKILKKLEAEEGVVVTRGLAKDNPYNDANWVAMMERKYKGTRLYRQEILGEILEDVEGALWHQEWLDATRVNEDELPALRRYAVGVDPATGGGTTGICVVALGNDNHLYVLEDLAKEGRTADEWAVVAIEAARRYHAPIVAENDQGGDMVRSVLKSKGADVTVLPARARNVGTKEARATPIALLWEKDDPEAHLVGADMVELEEELTTWVPADRDSPDRLDAMVWASIFLRRGASWDDTEAHWPTQAGRGPQGPARAGGFRRMVRWR